MGRVKEMLIDQEDHAEPCPTDFKTKKEFNEFMKTYMPSKKRKAQSVFNSSPTVRRSSDDGVPMSINMPFDNAAAWLDDEPWRKW